MGQSQSTPQDPASMAFDSGAFSKPTLERNDSAANHTVATAVSSCSNKSRPRRQSSKKKPTKSPSGKKLQVLDPAMNDSWGELDESVSVLVQVCNDKDNGNSWSEMDLSLAVQDTSRQRRRRSSNRSSLRKESQSVPLQIQYEEEE